MVAMLVDPNMETHTTKTKEVCAVVCSG